MQPDDTMSDELDRQVADRLAAVRARIDAAGGRDVSILAVTKTFSIDHCWAAYRAGCASVGENYAQEVVEKFGGLDVPFTVRFIGQLQTNKVRMLAPIVDVYESVDRASLVDEIARRVPGARVLVQVRPDTSDAAAKGGCGLADAPQLIDRALAAGLDVRGLMTVGPTEGGPSAARAGFRAVRALVDRCGLLECSMGMTDDLEVAVEEGSTQVRVGSALFGRRPPFGGPAR